MKLAIYLAIALAFAVLIWELDWGLLNMFLTLLAIGFIIFKIVSWFRTRSLVHRP